MLNGTPITEIPEFERLSPEAMEAIGKGPVGRTVFVRNLAYTVDENKCREVFGMAGNIISVDLVQDRETGKTKGFGTITFQQVSHPKNDFGLFWATLWPFRAFEISLKCRS